MLIALCILAAGTALLSMSTVALALVPAAELGITGLGAAAGFAVVSLGAGLAAAMLALGQERRA